MPMSYQCQSDANVTLTPKSFPFLSPNSKVNLNIKLHVKKHHRSYTYQRQSKFTSRSTHEQLKVSKISNLLENSYSQRRTLQKWIGPKKRNGGKNKTVIFSVLSKVHSIPFTSLWHDKKDQKDIKERRIAGCQSLVAASKENLTQRCRCNMKGSKEMET